MLQTFHAHPARNSDKISSFTLKLISKQRMHDTVDIVPSLQDSRVDSRVTNQSASHSELSCLTLQKFLVREPSGVPLRTCLKVLQVELQSSTTTQNARLQSLQHSRSLGNTTPSIEPLISSESHGDTHTFRPSDTHFQELPLGSS